MASDVPLNASSTPTAINAGTAATRAQPRSTITAAAIAPR
jgi:hypothetical protein